MVKPWCAVSLALVALLGAATPATSQCPSRCMCEVRPWFTPNSLYQEAATVDCNDLRLREVPRNLSEGAQVLLLQSNGIAEMGAELAALGNLTELDLSQNNLTHAGSSSFAGLGQLVILHLEENVIGELAEGELRDLGGLQELYVNHNQIESIHPGAFLGLRSLIRLHLNSNRLRAIDSRWFEFTPNLEILMVGANPVRQVEDMNFMPLSKLRSLVLAGMGLRAVPENALMGLDNLESLSFYDNKLAAVPRLALRKVPSLKFLDLNKNPIAVIREGDFRSMLQLKELGVNNMMELVAIDRHALDDLPQLTKLEVTNNPRLSFVHPDSVRAIPRLETLMLNNNDLSALHRRTVDALPNLREINLHGNPIRCDCIVRWMTGNATRVRFMEPQSTRCVSPAEHEGSPVRSVPSSDVADGCLPAIAHGAFPSTAIANPGATLTFVCRAVAEPPADIHWVTPSGDGVAPGGASDKYRLSEEGTLEIVDVRYEDTGLYTCVARNSEGLDSRAVTVRVNGSVPHVPGRLLSLDVMNVAARSVLVSWRLRPGGRAPDLRWTSATVRIDSPRVAFTARVPVSVHEYNLTRLQPRTEYEVCLAVSAAPRGSGRAERSCVNVTTRAERPGAPTGEEGYGGGDAVGRGTGAAALAVALGSALGLAALLALLACSALRGRRQRCHLPSHHQQQQQQQRPRWHQRRRCQRYCERPLRKLSAGSCSSLQELQPPPPLWEEEGGAEGWPVPGRSGGGGGGSCGGGGGFFPVDTSKSYNALQPH
ncbi:leucine-rich repeat neuronal protein 1-like [Lethenteron reissneri]|uniref:leucine-rich repeat neuronal protein 1-like n=1 Tax=Lethenteron reissneri TaxID=7753 RepID=UPI002AB65FFB|nr:leucine-rich repeat neuronal protein 1-like [Lethenteron reissneri]